MEKCRFDLVRKLEEGRVRVDRLIEEEGGLWKKGRKNEIKKNNFGVMADIAKRCRLMQEVQADGWIVVQTESDNVILRS